MLSRTRAAMKRYFGLRGVILIVVVLVCVALVGFNLFRTRMIGEFFATMQIPSVAVSATTIEPVTWTPEIAAIGTLSAIRGVDVASQVAGVVQSIPFDANENVDAGDLLVQIDDSVERADVMAAEAALERDRAQLERARRLRESGVNSEATLEDAQSALAASDSSLARIRAVLDQKSIEAPFAGTVGIPRIEVGQYVQAGTVVGTLQQLDTMRVDFTVPEQQMADLSMGQSASFGVTEDAFPYTGRIIGVDPKIDPQTRLISVRADLANPDASISPGQFVRVRVALPPVEGIIALPQTAIVTSLYGDYVYVVEPAPPAAGQPAAGGEAALRESLPAEGDAADGDANAAATPPAAGSAETLVAKQVFVKIGRRQGDLVEVAEGLAPGQTVVTSGQNKLANNAPVTIDNSVDPAADASGDADQTP